MNEAEAMPAGAESLAQVDRNIGRAVFGTDAHGYAAGRLPYPPALYDWLDSRRGLNGASVVEIGPGTGLATTVLLSRGVAAVHAIEPDPALASTLAGLADRRITVDAHPFDVAAAALIERDARFELGVAATSFHWLEPATALPLLRPLLQDGGCWALWWNVYRSPGAPSHFDAGVAALFAALGGPEGHGSSAHRPYGLNRDARRIDLGAAGLRDADDTVFDWSLPLDAAAAVALYATFSRVRLAAAARRAAFLDSIRALVDLEGGTVRQHVRTPIYVGYR